jgi:hypothetical protein
MEKILSMTNEEQELRKQLRLKLDSVSENLKDNHGNDCKSLPITSVMRTLLENEEIIKLSYDIRSLYSKRKI